MFFGRNLLDFGRMLSYSMSSETAFSLLITIYSIEARRRVSYLVFFSAVLLPVLLIGYLITHDFLSGIALAMAFTGIIIAILAWIKRYVDKKVVLETDKWLEKEFGEDEKENEKDELTPILLDENAVYEPDRIKVMHEAYERMYEVYASFERDLHILNANKNTISALIRLH